MKWLALHIGGQKWSVHLVSPKSKYLNEKGEKYDGRCFFEQCRIYINRELSEQEREDTLLHELIHAWIRISGAWTILEDALGEKEGGRYDELLVSAGSPILHRLLKDLGFRFPRGPYA